MIHSSQKKTGSRFRFKKVNFCMNQNVTSVSSLKSNHFDRLHAKPLSLTLGNILRLRRVLFLYRNCAYATKGDDCVFNNFH